MVRTTKYVFQIDFVKDSSHNFIVKDHIIEFHEDPLDNNSLVRVKRLIRVLEKTL